MSSKNTGDKDAPIKDAIKFEGTQYHITADSFNDIVVSNSKRIREIDTERVEKRSVNQQRRGRSAPAQFANLLHSLLV